MPNYTTNLNLEKPLQSEQYNIDVFNANADKIDQFAGQVPARALTADKLTTGAKINGVNFKGDTDIVTGAGFYYETVTYSEGDLAFIYNSIGNLELHKSLQNLNIGHNPLTSTGYWEKVELGGSGGRNVGEIISSTLPLTDAGLHLLDGARLSGDGIYGEFVDYIADLYAENPSANYFTTEALWQQSVTTYGVCGKFVYDSVNNTVRLPKITGILEGTTDISALGDLIEAGLPNHSHTLANNNNTSNNIAVNGYLNFRSDFGGGDYKYNLASNNTYPTLGLTGNASDSNSIYGNSSTVQPQTIKTFYYIVVATSTKTDIEVDIDNIATDLNGKADVDLSNINASQSAKNEIISWGLPDLSNGITYANDTTVHTAPSDGYILLSGRATSGSLTFYINGINIGWSYATASYAMGMSWFVPVSMGDTFYIDQSYTANVYRFYPMKGSN